MSELAVMLSDFLSGVEYIGHSWFIMPPFSTSAVMRCYSYLKKKSFCP